MYHLFAEWEKVSSQLKASSSVLLLFDYDGTLTPIVETPQKAVLSEEVRGLLQSLRKNCLYKVGVISGRALGNLKDKVRVEGIVYAGNHGLEIEDGELKWVNPVAEETRPLWEALISSLSIALGGIPGVIVEDKGLTLSVHYRLVKDEEVSKVNGILDKIVEPWRSQGKIRLTSGKKVYEIRPPVSWDKGKAIAWLLEKYAGEGNKGCILPVFLGDDLTDEDGFTEVNRREGVSIFVGERNPYSAAHYFLTSPQEVKDFLEKLVELN